MNTTTPADFMVHYFGPDWTLEHAEDMAAKMRGELRIFKHCERYVGQERLDAWADTEAQSRQIIKIVPVTTDFDALLAFLDAEVAEGYEQDTDGHRMTNPLQALERALKEINPNCDAWYSDDTYISWAGLMRAIRIAQSPSKPSEDIA